MPPTLAYSKCAASLEFKCDKSECRGPSVAPGGGGSGGSGLANGASCTFDADCASENCATKANGGTKVKSCAAAASGTKANGATCTFDDECISNNCENKYPQNVCAAAASGTKANGASCTLDDECTSNNCDAAGACADAAGGNTKVPTMVQKSKHYTLVTNVDSCETYPDVTLRTIKTKDECQIASDEINSEVNAAAGYIPEENTEVTEESAPQNYYPEGCFEWGEAYERRNGIDAWYFTEPSTEPCSESYPCFCANLDTVVPVPAEFPEIVFRSSDNYQLVTSRSPKRCEDFNLFPIMDPATCEKALVDVKLKNKKWSLWDIFTNEDGQSNGCYYDPFFQRLYIEKDDTRLQDGTCQLGYPCLCATTLAASNTTGTTGRLLRSSSQNKAVPTVQDAVVLREWADRHLTVAGTCGSSVDNKGCCSTICGGSEYISSATCTMSGSLSGTETCECTNAEKADQTYCAGTGSTVTVSSVITCSISPDASPRGKPGPICPSCATCSTATISYSSDSGEVCICTNSNGNPINVDDATCKTLWTSTYAPAMCCGFGPAGATQATNILQPIRMLCVAALLSVIIGLLPIFIGGVAKMYRMESCSIVSGTVGLVFQWCCGFFLAIIFILIPFLMGEVAYAACDSVQLASQSMAVSCTNIPECSIAFNAQVISVCNIGGGLRAASGLTLFCVILSVFTGFLTCAGFCTKKDSQHVDNPLNIVMAVDATDYKPI